MAFALDDILRLIQEFMLPFTRLGALLLAAPFYGARTIPVRIRVFLAAVVTLVLMPTIRVDTPVEIMSAEGVLLAVQQVVIGVGMGFVLQFVIAAVVMAGHAVATSMGLSFAASVDPQAGTQVTIVGQFYLILATLFFLSINGHLQLLQLLALSFQSFPVDTFVLNADFFREVVFFSAQMFITGTLLALPVMIGVLLINIGFGVMTRAAPQLNIFSIGFPMSLLGGFCLMLLGMPVLLPVLGESFAQTFGLLSTLFGP